MAPNTTTICDIKQIMVKSKMFMMARYTGLTLEYIGLRPRFKMSRHPMTNAALLIVQSDHIRTAAETYLANRRKSRMTLLAPRFIPCEMGFG